MTEILNMPSDTTIRVNQLDLPVELVKGRFRKIRYKHLEYIKLVFQDFTGEISSIKNYIITTIYNAPTTCDIYFDYRVKYDMCKETSQYLS